MRRLFLRLRSLTADHLVQRAGRGLAMVALASGMVYLGHVALGCRARTSPVDDHQQLERPTLPAAEVAADHPDPGAAATPAAGRVAPAAPLPDHSADLEELIAGLSPQLKQRLSDALYVYASAPAHREETPRAVLGASDAPVRIVVWGDILCRQCALLHDTLGYVRAQAPPGSLSLELRQYPLEGHCNPHMDRREEHSLHCTVAKMMVCAEGSGHEFDLLTAFYRNQASLPRELAMEMTAAFIGWDRLTGCLHDPALEAKLLADTDYAARVDADVLPYVLVNGRRAPAFGPFLFAMSLSGGRTDHPAFDALPPANPEADFELAS
jgi:hypothetical protein